MTETDPNVAHERAGEALGAEIASADDVRRALTRMAHEIIERHGSATQLVVIGLQSGGLEPAQHLAEQLERIVGHDIARGSLDVAFYRDDLALRPVVPEAATEIAVDLDGKVVVLVDDVLFTGRTIRAALNALSDFGRAKSVELAVLVDRGHRELPIRPDYVGKNLPTARSERVDASVRGIWLGQQERSAS